jgi:hypothetical protein
MSSDKFSSFYEVNGKRFESWKVVLIQTLDEMKEPSSIKQIEVFMKENHEDENRMCYAVISRYLKLLLLEGYVKFKFKRRTFFGRWTRLWELNR